ncbi:MAG: thymidylate synthase [Candidatus Thorarchaeota archaeon]
MKSLLIEGKSVRDVWLKTILEVFKHGIDIKTEYDKPEDPASKDSTVLIQINNPNSDPISVKNRIMKYKTKYGNEFEIFGHESDLYLIESVKTGYIEEILDGKMDHKIGEGPSYPYSYHDRIFNYKPYSFEDFIAKFYNIPYRNLKDISNKEILKDLFLKLKNDEIYAYERPNSKDSLMLDINDDPFIIGKKEFISIEHLNFPEINQIDLIVEKLKKSPYSRRCQAITWRPYSDPFRDDPPCLQRLFFRVINGELIMETSWRSRDLFKAWSSNVNGMIRLQEQIAKKLNVKVGTYIDFSNSLHIYGKDFRELKDLLIRIAKREKDKSEYLYTFIDKINDIFIKIEMIDLVNE